MITLPTTALEIEEVKREKALIPAQEGGETVISNRPDVTEARVYRLRSGFVNNSVFITLGFIKEHNRNRPIEIFINSKDLTRAAEYAVLTRLISAIFRKLASASPQRCRSTYISPREAHTLRSSKMASDLR